MKSELLTKSQLAERFGVDVRSITNWAAEGMPQRSRSGKPAFAWAECRDWRENKVREDARATRHAGGSEDVKVKMAELRLRAALAETESAELDLAERRGQLVTIDYMTGEFERITSALRASLLSLPAAWADRLGSCATTVDRMLMLEDCVNELMSTLSGGVEDDGEPDEDDRSDGGDEPDDAGDAPQGAVA